MKIKLKILTALVFCSFSPLISSVIDAEASTDSEVIKSYQETLTIPNVRVQTFSGSFNSENDLVSPTFTATSTDINVNFEYKRLHSMNTEFSVNLQKKVGSSWVDVDWKNLTATSSTKIGQVYFTGVKNTTYRIVFKTGNTLGVKVTGGYIVS
ncbi:hypothetical protein GMB51_13240 [Turicibacter sanguinis]|uniref:hypothetical protein n=1 Tax=Turicibacter sanguinis TaxID=154288 RepID=UPI0012BCDF62|nr:hypothetical protein [Turicibacter sanguinis]MDB8562379.1 hypothetical protein [Turicibacter sanguinis]MTN46128.1 hypothetical protein [Turicibacter sanguinis]MTN51970.1 hypothetical protein [Turicibacter sanguinis]MTN55019.1 hypothetical protein [Turicibacter sanguinis]MTN58235.1 hypothetical protein [Turicibacter sanguinis]